MWEVPWKITLEVKRFKQLRNSGVIRVEHVLIEGNPFTNYFKNMGTHFASTKNITISKRFSHKQLDGSINTTSFILEDTTTTPIVTNNHNGYFTNILVQDHG